MLRPGTTVPASVLVLVLLAGGCYTSVNSPIAVADGETRQGDLSTVNGSVSVGRGCTVEGKLRTVNGSVEVGERSTVRGLGTVNGAIETDADVVVAGAVSTVNGSIELGAGTRVEDEISTINGSIQMVRATVAGDLRTANGNVRLLDHSVVEGDVVVRRTKGGGRRPRPLEIVLDGGSLVLGNVLVEDPSIEVRVVLRGGGEVRGRVEHAQVVREDV